VEVVDAPADGELFAKGVAQDLDQDLAAATS
jgi:hypothetical protein